MDKIIKNIIIRTACKYDFEFNCGGGRNEEYIYFWYDGNDVEYRDEDDFSYYEDYVDFAYQQAMIIQDKFYDIEKELQNKNIPIYVDISGDDYEYTEMCITLIR